MYRYLCLAVMVLLLATQLEAACNDVNNQDLIEYNCEGGSINDISLIPSNAEKIRISNMSVGRISVDLFSRFGSNLVVLTCSHCLITDIDDDAFRRLENLQQLSLDNNHLKEVRADWFEGLVYLTYLDLNYNDIERIDSDVFRNAPEIVDLRLSGNRLPCLDLEGMSRLHDLKRIFLNDNPSFACPNAMKKFLNERNVDYEADAHWSTTIEDQVPAGEPLPSVLSIYEDSVDSTVTPPNTSPRSSTRKQLPTLPSSPSSLWPSTPTSYYTRRVTTETPNWSTITPTLNPPPRPPYIREMVNPSVPEQGFTYQGPYYVPEVTQQQLDNYRSTIVEQMEKNKSVSVTTTTSTTTTECPNIASCFSIDLSLLITLLLTATLFTCG